MTDLAENPLRDTDGPELRAWLEGLSDTEVIALMSRVSSEMKRRNGLLVRATVEDQEAEFRRKLDDFLHGPPPGRRP